MYENHTIFKNFQPLFVNLFEMSPCIILRIHFYFLTPILGMPYPGNERLIGQMPKGWQAVTHRLSGCVRKPPG